MLGIPALKQHCQLNGKKLQNLGCRKDEKYFNASCSKTLTIANDNIKDDLGYFGFVYN